MWLLFVELFKRQRLKNTHTKDGLKEIMWQEEFLIICSPGVKQHESGGTSFPTPALTRVKWDTVGIFRFQSAGDE
jgi:hypothetical protein